MSKTQYCDKPDRDVGHKHPNIKCGYPLPCPFHTIVIDMAESPTTTIPPFANVDPKTREHISEIVNALKDNK